MNKERAYVQLISKLLGVEFDSIWQRHKRLLLQKIITWIVVFFVVLAAFLGVWFTNQPVDVEVRLNETSIHNDNLPQIKDAVVTLTLDNEIKTDTIRSLETGTIFNNIPHRFINNNVRVRVDCKYFLPVDTVMILLKNNLINISRNPEVFGNVYFRLWNPDTERTSANTELSINGHPGKSDNNGYVSVTIPLGEQKTAYLISSSSIKLVDETVEVPCGPDDIIQFK